MVFFHTKLSEVHCCTLRQENPRIISQKSLYYDNGLRYKFMIEDFWCPDVEADYYF